MPLFPENILKDNSLNSIYWPCATCFISYARQNVLVAKEAQKSKETSGIWNSVLPKLSKTSKSGKTTDL